MIGDRSHIVIDEEHFRAQANLNARSGAKPDCRIHRADRWKLLRSQGPYHFCLFDYGGGYLVLRLFNELRNKQYYERRVWKWCKMRPQSSGIIRWKKKLERTSRIFA